MTGWDDPGTATPIADEQAMLDHIEAAESAGPDVWPVSLIEYVRRQWWAATGELFDWTDPDLADLRDLAATHGLGMLDQLAAFRNATAYGPGDLARALASFDPVETKRRKETRELVAGRCWEHTRPRRWYR